MILHDASSGTIVHEVSLCLWHPLPFWRTLAGNPFTLVMVVLSICGFGEFGGVLLRENVPGIFMLPRAGGHQLVHGPGSKCS